MLAAAGGGVTRLFRISDRKVTLLSSAPTANGNSLGFAPNGTTLAVGSHGGIVLFAITGGSLTPMVRVPASGWVTAVDFSPDGTQLGVVDGAGVHVLDIVWPDNADLRTRVCGLVWRNLSGSEWSTLAPPGLQNPNACPS